MSRTMRIPGPDHPITAEPAFVRVVVQVAGRVIADSSQPILLREAGYEPVLYLPRSDVDITLLERAEHVTWCPYKGECAYYSITIGGERSVNSVWTYEAPFPAVGSIKDHMAFYADRVDSIQTIYGQLSLPKVRASDSALTHPE